MGGQRPYLEEKLHVEIHERIRGQVSQAFLQLMNKTSLTILSKCNLWMPMAQLKDADVVADRLGVKSASHGLTVLGVPVGKDNWTLQGSSKPF